MHQAWPVRQPDGDRGRVQLAAIGIRKESGCEAKKEGMVNWGPDQASRGHLRWVRRRGARMQLLLWSTQVRLEMDGLIVSKMRVVLVRWRPSFLATKTAASAFHLPVSKFTALGGAFCEIPVPFSISLQNSWPPTRYCRVSSAFDADFSARPGRRFTARVPPISARSSAWSTAGRSWPRGMTSRRAR